MYPTVIILEEDLVHEEGGEMVLQALVWLVHQGLLAFPLQQVLAVDHQAVTYRQVGLEREW